MIGEATRTVMLRGQEFAYLDSGDGPTVLFIHGLTNSSRSWLAWSTR